MTSSKLYYLQDSRGSGTVGNCILWWAKEGRGYTTNLDKAMVFTEEEAQSYHNTRETDIPWPKDYIDERSAATVDKQLCSLMEAMEGSGVKLVPRKKPRKLVSHCGKCGSWISERQFYVTGCKRCGWTYAC